MDSDFSHNPNDIPRLLKAVADAKSAIRYFRKDFANGDTYGIDSNTIFIGGYSAGGVIAVHLAYIDNGLSSQFSSTNLSFLINP